MLRLTFRNVLGESLLCTRASCFHFRPDGTLRAEDNFVVATRVNDCWQFGHRLFREFECEGPVFLRARKTASAKALAFGPYKLAKSIGGMLYGDDVFVGVHLPTLHLDPADSWHEVSILQTLDASRSPQE
jgi:hypothetical protein